MLYFQRLNARRCFAWLRESPNSPPSSTAWLDGLRGIAALLVFWHHHQMWARTLRTGATMERSFGYNDTYYLATLPIVRLLFSGGHFAVAIFFVVSGYGLSVKPLRLIHSGRHQELGSALASSIFRRWLRLFAPVACTTLTYLTLWHVVGFDVHATKPQETWSAELYTWFRQFKEFSFVFSTHIGPSGYSPRFDYNPHLWTIPIEMKGSLITYASILSLSRCSIRTRLGWQVALVLYFLYIVDGWYGAMFVAGSILRECDLLINRRRPAPLHLLAAKTRAVYWSLIVLGLVLGGVPHTPSATVLRRNPGWYYLSFLKPEAMSDHKWIYLFCASSLVVATVPRLPETKRILETQTCRYLGNISYGLYLVHGPILWTIGDGLYAAAGCWQPEKPHASGSTSVLGIKTFMVPIKEPLGLERSFLLPQLFLLPVTLILASTVHRYVDRPSVKFMQWIYTRCLSDTSPQGGE
ncbi:hypothetical protein AK830_g8412 [Neonectria ditissima]|uniref:Acyltransferase 3 domain-containing protein n=1 Tax=Neonectria ditissima TaxID=78410 RepID=A0A0P7BBG0_9HYPO|nr:hypothetical protein AK830_g8412 [Neonectria ditissima]